MVKRIYAINWFLTKEKRPLARTSYIRINNASGDTSIDAKRAVNIFVSSFGNLKKNTIIWIKELDEAGNQLGEDIIPTGDSIIPEKR